MQSGGRRAQPLGDRQSMDSSLMPPWQDRLGTDTTVEKAQVEVLSLTVPGLTLLGHPDPQRTGERVVLRALVSGREALLSRIEPQFAAPTGEGPWRPLADPHLSRRPLLLAPAPLGGVRLSAAGSPTPVLAGGLPLGEDRSFSARDLASGVVLLLASRIVLLLHRFLPHPDVDTPSFGLIGESDAIREVRRQIRQVADLDLPVLLRGEPVKELEIIREHLAPSGHLFVVWQPFDSANIESIVDRLTKLVAQHGMAAETIQEKLPSGHMVCVKAGFA